MHSPSSPSRIDTASILVHGIIEDAPTTMRPRELANHVEAQASADVLPTVRPYIEELRRWSHEVTIGALPEGVGGQFDGSIDVALRTVDIDPRGLEWTILAMQEAYAHELYHTTHEHLKPMQTMDETDSVIIAGEGIETRDIIEALTVEETGDETVSQEYQENRGHVFSLLAHAGLGIADMREAVNEAHDLTLLDDRRHASTEPQTSIAL